MSKEEKSVAEILQRIIEKRRGLGLSQKDLAVHLNLSFNGYFKIEKGYTQLSMYRLFQISDALNVSPSFFLRE